MAGIKAREVPFFPEALLVLQAVWRKAMGRAVRTRNIIGAGDLLGRALHVSVSLARSTAVPTLEAVPVDLIVLGAGEVRRLPGVTSVPAHENNPLAAFATGRGRARLRELVKQRMPAAAVMLLCAASQGKSVAWRVQEVLRRPDDYGLQ